MNLAKYHKLHRPDNTRYVSQVVDHIEENQDSVTSKPNARYPDNPKELKLIDVVFSWNKQGGNDKAHKLTDVDKAMNTLAESMTNYGVSKDAVSDIIRHKTDVKRMVATSANTPKRKKRPQFRQF